MKPKDATSKNSSSASPKKSEEPTRTSIVEAMKRYIDDRTGTHFCELSYEIREARMGVVPYEFSRRSKALFDEYFTFSAMLREYGGDERRYEELCEEIDRFVNAFYRFWT